MVVYNEDDFWSAQNETADYCIDYMGEQLRVRDVRTIHKDTSINAPVVIETGGQLQLPSENHGVYFYNPVTVDGILNSQVYVSFPELTISETGTVDVNENLAIRGRSTISGTMNFQTLSIGNGGEVTFGETAVLQCAPGGHIDVSQHAVVHQLCNLVIPHIEGVAPTGFSNDGYYEVHGTLINECMLINAGEISVSIDGKLLNSGEMENGHNYFVNSGDDGIQIEKFHPGTIRVQGQGYLENSGTIKNPGAIIINQGGTLLNKGIIQNVDEGTVEGTITEEPQSPLEEPVLPETSSDPILPEKPEEPQIPADTEPPAPQPADPKPANPEIPPQEGTDDVIPALPPEPEDGKRPTPPTEGTPDTTLPEPEQLPTVEPVLGESEEANT